MPSNVIFKRGTSEQFQAIEQKDVNTLYWLSDTQELYNGDTLYGTGKTATQEKAGLMSAEDKAKLDAMSVGGISGLTPVDASVVIVPGEEDTTIGVQLSQEEGNTIVLKADGLYAGGIQPSDIPEYALEKMTEATEGYSASYRLKRTLDGAVTYPGDVINIPKDLVLQSGNLKLVEEANVPYEGAQVGDPYIDLVLNDPASSHIYIPMKGIIDTDELTDVYVVNGLTGLSEGAAESNILAAIGSYEALLAAVQADKVVVDRVTSGATTESKVATSVSATNYGINLVFVTGSAKSTIYQIQNVGGTLALGVTNIEYARKSELPDVSGLQAVVDSMPDQIISELVNVDRTATTNTAELRIFTKTESGTYSPAVQHGVLTLIPAGEGPDGKNGAGLMSLADKQKLDAIDLDEIEAAIGALTWSEM